MDKEKIEQGIRLVLEGVGEDLNRDGLKDTPKRVADMYGKILDGYNVDPKKYIKLFDDESNDMVTVTNIPIYSFCEHHMTLMFGKLSIAYIPSGKVIGLSKLIRLSRLFAKRFQIQERLTRDIAECIQTYVSCDCAVLIEMEHMCMSIRGVRAPGSKTVTSAMRGRFLKHELGKNPKEEFLRIVNNG